MEKLIKSIEGVHPGKYDLRRNELDELYDAYHHDTFKLIISMTPSTAIPSN